MPSPSLSEIVAEGGYISFQCRRCGWIKSPPMDGLIDRFGGDMTIDRLDGRGRCFQAHHSVLGPCGGRGYLWLNLPSGEPMGAARGDKAW